ncbi:uncharacterized protein LOC119731911 [Patiria miniata]|uniref:Uncharacterized protein n=1 Tax=Patiria miniata TaxID=46514 RepID=A0A914AB90_PATMI|nr:uncharacterized protein LOC119731911 [Patiria miniata]
MNVDTHLQLGQSTGLLAGFQANVSSAPFNDPGKPALYESQIRLKEPDLDAKWDWPTITLHGNTESLLSALVQVKLRPRASEGKPSEGGGFPSWPSGALILAGLTPDERAEALQKLSSQVGVDLSNNDLSYALVRRTRTVGKATYTSYEKGLFRIQPGVVRPEAMEALKALEKTEDPTLVSIEGAKGYLNFYETFGSHFISSIQAGDSLYQVFAYAEAEFKVISEFYADQLDYLTGPSAPSFVIFTTPKNEAGYGYTEAAGTIGIESGDPAMAQSLADGLWLDTEYSGTNSIFIPYVGPSEGININETLQKVTVISTQLASLSVYAEYYRMLIWWRIFKAAMYAKYANGVDVAPYLSNNCPYDLQEVYKDSNPISGDGLLSTLATPVVNIFQERVELSQVNLQFPELVETFSVFSNAIEVVPNPQEFPDVQVNGSSTVTLFGHIFSSGGTSAVPPNLLLSESAYKAIKGRISSGEFYGGLRVSCVTSGQFFVIMNGLIFEYAKGKVSIPGDVRVSPSQEVALERVVDLQFGLVAAEARLNFLFAEYSKDDPSMELMKRYLYWLAAVAGGESGTAANEQLAAVQARALQLATVAANPMGAGVPVPYLKYDAYKDVVNNVQNVLNTASYELSSYQEQIRDRKAEERLIDNLDALNENIIKTGQLLCDYISAQASYQGSIADMFSSIFEDQKKKLDMAADREKELRSSLEGQRNIVKDEVAKYKKAVVNWQDKEMLKAAFDVAEQLFKIDFIFKAPGNAIDALKEMEVTVQKIQDAMKAFDVVMKAYESLGPLPSDPQAVVDALQDIGLNGVQMPSTLEWDELKMNMDATLGSGPPVPERYILGGAFNILVARGKALMECQATIQQISADLSSLNMKIQLSEEQQKRLEELKVVLDAKPDELEVPKVDLIGLSGQLLLFQRQMLMTLASTVMIQDRGLQYEYIRPPTPIGSFTMLNLQLTMVKQSQSINEGMTVQPPPMDYEHPIFYEIHGVNPNTITNNQAHSFDIQMNRREFAFFNYVRVKKVEVEIGGIKSTNSGKYYTELVFDGKPFFDRGFNGEPLTFQTVSRIFTGLHEVSSSSHVPPLQAAKTFKPSMRLAIFGDRSFDNISEITPFSTWKVSLPATSSNEGIQFDNFPGGVTVRLIFHIFAQLKETGLTPKEIFMRSHDLLISRGLRTSHPVFKQAKYKGILPEGKQKAKPGGRYLSKVSGKDISKRRGARTTNVSKDEVLKMMSGKSVCAGWDVVFSMTAQQVNEQLYMQYQDRQGNPAFVRETGDISSETESSEGVIMKTAFNFKFNAPRLEFLLNNSSSGQVSLPMISGSYEYSILAEGNWIVIDKVEVLESDGAYVKGDVPLAVLAGSVSSQNNVCVKLNGGAFSAENFTPGTSNPNMNATLTNYFTGLQDGYEVYKFGTIDYTGVSTIESLKPKNFIINTYQTPSDRDLLQLFIATTGELQSTGLYLQEPIPSSYQSSLIINTQIFYKDVLPASLGDGGIGLILKANSPGDDPNKDKVWSTTATSGTVSAPYPPTKVGEDSHWTDYGTFYYEYYVKVPGDRVHVDLTGMAFKFGDSAVNGWTVKSKFQVTDSPYDFEYGSRDKLCDVYGCGDWHKVVYKPYSTTVDINMDSTLPFAVTGTGQDQSLKVESTSSNVKVDGNFEPPSGACGCDDSELQSRFLTTLRNNLIPQMKAVFNRPFPSISIFALKNILFPAKNVIDLKEAFVPGDMVVFGNFTE